MKNQDTVELTSSSGQESRWERLITFFIII
jgi:hypothetical protein